ncbi:hypothetical protein NDU88_000654 [Pleurodeles waltl]|uniref:Uncharacterized protein n=1 Tax=Pleurodeles waltl TaxID=8319 RepID=A0AAV7V5N5_PLEWA|nr:hypothetical protein NDU88_000654 [Pleurodeles waltl]
MVRMKCVGRGAARCAEQRDAQSALPTKRLPLWSRATHLTHAVPAEHIDQLGRTRSSGVAPAPKHPHNQRHM